MNISFIGMPGSGKTTVATELVKIIPELKLVDTDEETVKQENCSINEIFENFGENTFRDIETKILSEILRKDNQIISTGGGIIKRRENIELLKEKSIIVYLKTKPESIYNRVKNDTTRPLLKTQDLRSRILSIYEERNEIYETNADYIITTDNKTPEYIAKEITEKIK